MLKRFNHKIMDINIKEAEQIKLKYYEVEILFF